MLYPTPKIAPPEALGLSHAKLQVSSCKVRKSSPSIPSYLSSITPPSPLRKKAAHELSQTQQHAISATCRLQDIIIFGWPPLHATNNQRLSTRLLGFGRFIPGPGWHFCFCKRAGYASEKARLPSSRRVVVYFFLHCVAVAVAYLLRWLVLLGASSG